MCGRGRIEEAAWARERKRERERAGSEEWKRAFQRCAAKANRCLDYTALHQKLSRASCNSADRHACSCCGGAPVMMACAPPPPPPAQVAALVAPLLRVALAAFNMRAGPGPPAVAGLSLSHRRSHPPSIVRSFSTHGQLSAAQGSLTTVSRSDVRLIQHLDSSALGLVPEVALNWLFPHPLVSPKRRSAYAPSRLQPHSGELSAPPKPPKPVSKAASKRHAKGIWM